MMIIDDGGGSGGVGERLKHAIVSQMFMYHTRQSPCTSIVLGQQDGSVLGKLSIDSVLFVRLLQSLNVLDIGCLGVTFLASQFGDVES